MFILLLQTNGAFFGIIVLHLRLLYYVVFKIQYYFLSLKKGEIHRCKSNKSVQDFYAENYEMLKKEIMERHAMFMN